MHVTTGYLKGRKILFPKQSKSLRPVLSRVKQNIFDLLQDFLKPGIKTLDLFAGTGALGIESISRGAKFCFFVDNKLESLNFLIKNIENLNLQDKSKLIKSDFKKLRLDQKSIDIIFIDPPYNMGLLNDAIEISLQFVKSDGCILIKRDKLESHGYKNIIKKGNLTIQSLKF